MLGRYAATGICDNNFFPAINKAKKFIDEECSLKVGEGVRYVAPKRILILRRGTRRLLNEVEIVAFLKRFGFVHFYFEDLSLSEQIFLFRGVEYLVSIHGAALGYLPFVVSEELRMIELFPIGFIVNPFRKIHSKLFPKGKWCGVVGNYDWRVVKEIDSCLDIKKFANQPFSVDIRSLERSLNYMGL